jgi:hypothetical protein
MLILHQAQVSGGWWKKEFITYSSLSMRGAISIRVDVAAMFHEVVDAGGRAEDDDLQTKCLNIDNITVALIPRLES